LEEHVSKGKAVLERRGIYFILLLVPLVFTSCSRPAGDFAMVDPDGTAHVTRVIPMPSTVSSEYAPNTDPKDPVLSPIFADLHGMPPTLLVTSTRDLLLSNTTIFHRALLRADNDAQLVVYESLPHAFWYHFQLPETREALELMAKFFDQRIAR
jgi:acetyl esterase/lipase